MTHSDPSITQLRRDPLPLKGRSALVTGASRRVGFGYAIARRLAAPGASLFLHHHAPHDHAQPWGADPGGPQAVVDEVAQALADPDATVHHLGLDLADPNAPAQLIDTATVPSGTWTSWSATTRAAAATARSAHSTPRCSTPTGQSTPGR